MLASKASASYCHILLYMNIFITVHTASQTVFSKMMSWCCYLVGTLCVEGQYEAMINDTM